MKLLRNPDQQHSGSAQLRWNRVHHDDTVYHAMSQSDLVENDRCTP